MDVREMRQAPRFDWQPRCLVSKTGSFASRPRDRFALFQSYSLGSRDSILAVDDVTLTAPSPNVHMSPVCDPSAMQRSPPREFEDDFGSTS